jgi:4-hydroxyproline epimerase
MTPASPTVRKVAVIDSHTGGERTRVVLSGGPDLGRGPMAERLERLRSQHDAFRSAVVNEPRGAEDLVGALLLEPCDPRAAAAFVFFNNVGYLGMCGHGTIGVVATLAHLGRLGPGSHRCETPVGDVTATLHGDGRVSVENVASWRAAKALTVNVPGIGRVTGDVAWGGNWFFLVEDHGLEIALQNLERLTTYTWSVRQELNAGGHPEVDHVELFGPPRTAAGRSRNFVLCPGKAYDRSPCGTGLSAKVACLASDGKLAEGETWVQESVVGSIFTASYRWLDRSAGKVAPTITGTAHVTAEATLLLDERDPFCWGIR